MLYCHPETSGGEATMTSDFELKMLAKLVHEDTIMKAQQRRFTRSLKKLRPVSIKEHRGFVIREETPCQC